MNEKFTHYLRRTGYTPTRKLTDIFALLLGIALTYVYAWFRPEATWLALTLCFFVPTLIAWVAVYIEYLRRRQFYSTFYEDEDHCEFDDDLDDDLRA